jgi:hypothetical protein
MTDLKARVVGSRPRIAGYVARPWNPKNRRCWRRYRRAQAVDTAGDNAAPCATTLLVGSRPARRTYEGARARQKGRVGGSDRGNDGAYGSASSQRQKLCPEPKRCRVGTLRPGTRGAQQPQRQSRPAQDRALAQTPVTTGSWPRRSGHTQCCPQHTQPPLTHVNPRDADALLGSATLAKSRRLAIRFRNLATIRWRCVAFLHHPRSRLPDKQRAPGSTCPGP